MCVAGEAIRISYEHCGRLGSLNVYWTYLEANQQLNILFESLDDGKSWDAFCIGVETLVGLSSSCTCLL